MGEPARHSEGTRGARRGRRRGPSRRLGTAGPAPQPRAGRTAALLGGALALIGVTAAPPAVAASPDYPATVTITDVQQTPDGKLDVYGTVSNPGPTALKAPKIGLTLGRGSQPLQLRGDIAAMLSRTDPVYQDGSPLPAPVQQLSDLAPGGSAPFHLPTTLAELKPGQNGFYELAVDVEAGTAEDDSPHQVGIGRTTLSYYPTPGDDKPLQVATLWPLTHAPELVPQTVQDSDQPVLRDDTLATDLGPNGRLGRLLADGQDIPSLTWVIDPDLLDAVQAMTKPYRVQQPGHSGEPATESNTVPGTGTAVATDWLNKLRAAVVKPNDQVIALPYGDPDLASIAHVGGALPDPGTFLTTARTAGKLTVDGRLPVDSLDTVAWPYQGYLDPQTARTTQQLGATQVLVDSASLPDHLNYSPNAARPIGQNQTAVVADDTIAGLFRSDLKTPEAKTQARQRFLAETLAIQQQRASVQRTLLVMPPRDLTADTADVLKASLKAAGDGHWISPASYTAVATAAPDADADTGVAGPDAYPADLRGSELPADTFDRIGTTQQQEQLLLQILTNQERVSAPFAAALERATSTQWRGDKSAASGYLENAQNYLGHLHNAVRIPDKSKTITLAGDSGVLQVSVRNELQQGVTNLELRLTSGQSNRLMVTSRQPITLDPAQSTSARFQAQALGNGAVQMTARLYTTGPNGQPYGEPVTFTVNVTQVTSGVWWVVGAGTVLVLAAGLRIFLKRRKHGDEPPADPDAPLADPDGPATDSDDPAGAQVDPQAPGALGAPETPEAPEAPTDGEDRATDPAVAPS
ncbi:hypothetical protein LN042_13275 [Kitasatospora sp. RB6PN24]|uniref:hypothetical protein n=1 Tax=Kitasatospora humi TaxID=2893891 RepID=UPI001E4DCD2A|nr:hypothetical protein [Kitasatospora humi]MCC9308049.1 hypothetical protein [Kitasatospora humi]